MTTEVEATNLIYTQFIDNWTFTPFVLENESFNVEDNVADDESWVRLTVDELTSAQDTLGETGNRKFKRFGIAILQIFTPKDTGVTQTTGSRQLINEFRTLFEGVRLVGLTFFDVSWSTIGNDGSFSQTNVEATFQYEEVK